MSEYITNKISDVDISLDKILKVIEESDKRMYEATEIFLGNPYDLIQIDMLEIPRNCVFISSCYVPMGEFEHVKDGELKRDLYKFSKEHPDRVFRGQK